VWNFRGAAVIKSVRFWADMKASFKGSFMLGRLKKILKYRHQWKLKERDVAVYPNNKSCIKQDMSRVAPQQMPPLMVRKAAWRK
jgi:hypothetical protein